MNSKASTAKLLNKNVDAVKYFNKDYCAESGPSYKLEKRIKVVESSLLHDVSIRELEQQKYSQSYKTKHIFFCNFTMVSWWCPDT